jgi:enoyl-CoA hydratase
MSGPDVDRGAGEALVLTDRPARGVLVLTLNRPNKLNALSVALLARLARELAAVASDRDTGAVVLTGAGRAFSAGADVGEMLARGAEIYTDPARLAAWHAIESFPKPLIGAINGYALGGGLELALLCDILLASETARFGTPEIELASFPGDGGTQRLPRLVGRSFAMQMILTGEPVEAALAERKGLVSETVPPDRLLARAVAVASVIAGKSLAITPYAKQAVRAADELPLAEGLRLERRLVSEAYGKQDRQEGLSAFAEKRAPRFRGE